MSGDIAAADSQLEPGFSIPLTYDDAIVGALVLHDGSRHGHDVIRIAGRMAELLIHQAAVIDRLPDQARLRDKLMAELLHGSLPPNADSPPVEAAIFDIDLDLPRVVAVIDVESTLRTSARADQRRDNLPRLAEERRRERARADLLWRASRLHGGLATDAWGFADDRWLVLLAVVDLSSLEASRRRIAGRLQRTVDDLVQTTRTSVSAGVGRYYPGWPALAHSFQDACLAAEVGPTLGGARQVFAPEELGFAEVLAEAGSVAKDELVRRLLAPLEGDQELLSTLEAFLQANLSSQVAARSLSIHRHTMAYRLDKIERLTDLDPRQFQHAAQFHAALWWRRLASLGSRREQRTSASPGPAPVIGRVAGGRRRRGDRARER